MVLKVDAMIEKTEVFLVLRHILFLHIYTVKRVVDLIEIPWKNLLFLKNRNCFRGTTKCWWLFFRQIPAASIDDRRC